MTGGYCIIPIRGINNQKLTLTSTAQDLKPGTFAKIKRAISMQKSVKLQDLTYDGKIFNLADDLVTVGTFTDNLEVLYTVGRFPTSGGTGRGSVYITITNADTIVAATS